MGTLPELIGLTVGYVSIDHHCLNSSVIPYAYADVDVDVKHGRLCQTVTWIRFG